MISIEIDISKVERKQDEILIGYQKDFVKYADTKDYPKISAVWQAIPSQLGKENRKFIFSQIKKGWRAKDLEDSLTWLINAGLIYMVNLKTRTCIIGRRREPPERKWTL